MLLVGLHILNMTNCDMDMIHGPTDFLHFLTQNFTA